MRSFEEHGAHRASRFLRTAAVLVALVAVVSAIAACSGEPEPTQTPAPTAPVIPELTTATAIPDPTGIPLVETATVTPTATRAARPTATPTTTPAAPAPTSTSTIDDLLASIEQEVELIRGIDTPPPAGHTFVDRAGMRAQLNELLNDPEVVEQIVKQSTLLKLLGVIPQDSDLTALYESMLGGQVLGLYDPEKEEFFVLRDDDSGPGSLGTEARLTYAHEYVHRLQDYVFDLEVVTDRHIDEDMLIAISALVEGDATTAQTVYMLQNFDSQELSDLFESITAAQADLEPVPYFLQRSLEFAYVEGAAFVIELARTGGFAAVDDAFINLPRSTEQILHPEKYFGAELPVELDVPDDAMGTGWSVQAESVLGEFSLKTWLEALGSEQAGVALAGWGGDSYAVFVNEAGVTAFGMMIAWDADGEAAEFFEIASAALNAHLEFSSLGAETPGVLVAWDGPGGFLTLSRQNSDDHGEVIVIAITPDAEGSVALVEALIGKAG